MQALASARHLIHADLSQKTSTHLDSNKDRIFLWKCTHETRIGSKRAIIVGFLGVFALHSLGSLDGAVIISTTIFMLGCCLYL
jgi:hypothetical protein